MDFLKQRAKDFGNGVIFTIGIVAIAAAAAIGAKVGERAGDAAADLLFPTDTNDTNSTTTNNE
jgi:hypothetical protein